MYIRDIIRNPYVYGVLTVLTLGLFAHVWLVYMVFRLKTYKTFLSRPILAITVILLIIRHISAFITVIVVAQWFAIPKKLADMREYNGLEANISWLIGLIPTLATFYTFGFLFIHAPTRELSDSTIVAIGIPMLISLVIAQAIYVFKVQEKFKEYLEKRELDMLQRMENSQIRRQKRTTQPQMLESYRQEELPMFELSDFGTVNQGIDSEDDIVRNKQADFTLQFDDDLDDDL